MAGLNLGQAGYQAVATCCLKEKDGIKLIEEMSVSAFSSDVTR